MGQMADPSTSDTQWAHRKQELLNRHLYLKDFWYAAGAHLFAPSGIHRKPGCLWRCSISWRLNVIV